MHSDTNSKAQSTIAVDDGEIRTNAQLFGRATCAHHARECVAAVSLQRLGQAAVTAFCGPNGCRLTLINDQAYDLVMKTAAGELDLVGEIAAVLRAATAPRL